MRVVVIGTQKVKRYRSDPERFKTVRLFTFHKKLKLNIKELRITLIYREVYEWPERQKVGRLNNQQKIKKRKEFIE